MLYQSYRIRSQYLKRENAFLRAQIIQLGIDATTSSQAAALSRQLLSSPLTGLLTPPAPSISLPSSSTHTAAQQLILSLAQSLSGSPLIGQGLAPSVSLTPSPSTPPKAHNLSSLTPSQLVSSLTSGSPSPLPNLASTPSIAPPLQYTYPIITSSDTSIYCKYQHNTINASSKGYSSSNSSFSTHAWLSKPRHLCHGCSQPTQHTTASTECTQHWLQLIGTSRWKQ